MRRGRGHLPARLARELAPPLSAAPTLCVLDLDPSLGVQVAAELNRVAVAHAVLLLPRWAYARALLPVDDLLATLVHTARRLPRATTRLSSVVFVLDRERSQAVRRPRGDRRADNRYRLLPGDLPTLATLRQAGIRHILKLSQQPLPPAAH
jgi:hypothetical protein